MAKFFVRFPSDQLRAEASAMLDIDPNQNGFYVPVGADEASRVLIMELSEPQRQRAQSEGAEVFDDIQFSILEDDCVTGISLHTSPRDRGRA